MAKASILPQTVTKELLLKRSTTLDRLEAQVEGCSGNIKDLKLKGRIAVLVKEPNFATIGYSVGIYEPRSLQKLFPGRLKLVSSASYTDQPEQAQALYSELI